MSEKTEPEDKTSQHTPRVLADFGGRRKIFERRMRPCAIGHKERRADSDRRSGFDRRGALTQSDDEDIIEKRSDFPGLEDI